MTTNFYIIFSSANQCQPPMQRHTVLHWTYLHQESHFLSGTNTFVNPFRHILAPAPAGGETPRSSQVNWVSLDMKQRRFLHLVGQVLSEPVKGSMDLTAAVDFHRRVATAALMGAAVAAEWVQRAVELLPSVFMLMSCCYDHPAEHMLSSRCRCTLPKVLGRYCLLC